MEYSIGETSKITGFGQHTLRYYEKEGLLPGIKRKENGIRIFDEGTVDWLKMIKCLKETGMTIIDMKALVDLTIEGEHTVAKRLEILYRHKKDILKKIEDLNKNMNKIDTKIEFYEGKSNNCE